MTVYLVRSVQVQEHDVFRVQQLVIPSSMLCQGNVLKLYWYRYRNRGFRVQQIRIPSSVLYHGDLRCTDLQVQKQRGFTFCFTFYRGGGGRLKSQLMVKRTSVGT